MSICPEYIDRLPLSEVEAMQPEDVCEDGMTETEREMLRIFEEQFDDGAWQF